ncbi:transposable element Tcb2 transposase [Trichonephila clavipes]|nr:transposable element Tcb2 transposase [Trichonephila clavipes]
MAVNDHTASSRQLAARWSTATGVLMSASSIRRRLLHRGFRARVPLYRIPLTANHRRLRLQLVHEHRSWRADWHQVVFSDEPLFNLWDHVGRIRVRRYAGERCLPESGIKRHSGLKPGVTVWCVVSYDRRYNSLRIEAQHMQLLPWSAYSPDISPIEHVWDLVGRLLARDPAASKDELLLRIQAIWNYLPQADIQNLLDSLPCRIAALIAARGGYTKY